MVFSFFGSGFLIPVPPVVLLPGALYSLPFPEFNSYPRKNTVFALDTLYVNSAI